MLISLTTFIVGLLGAASVTYGTWLVSPPLGYMVAGTLCLAWSWLAASAAGRQADASRMDERGREA